MRNFQALSQDSDLYAIVQVELIKRASTSASAISVGPEERCGRSRTGRQADRPVFDPATLTDEPGLRLPSAGAFLAGAAISPSRIACLRASLRDRLTASAFFLVILSEGFS
jgi:hypothetical protein